VVIALGPSNSKLKYSRIFKNTCNTIAMLKTKEKSQAIGSVKSKQNIIRGFDFTF